MAQLTKGYSFAFQVLGYLTWKYNGDYQKALPEFQQYLEEYVYEKMWSECSAIDKKVLVAMVKTPSDAIIDIRKTLSMTTNQFNPYRKRLIQKGLIDGSERGHITLTLPLFDDTLYTALGILSIGVNHIFFLKTLFFLEIIT